MAILGSARNGKHFRYLFFLTLVCQVLFFLGDVRARARKRARARACREARARVPAPGALLLLASGLESWPDSRLALGFALARGSWLGILA